MMQKTKNTLSIMIIFGLIVSSVFVFQNCSEVSFAPSKLKDPFQEISRDPTKYYSMLEVGSADVPDLKMVFIVDNSYTMKANQVNLSQAFENMLSDKNSANLTPFNMTAYLFNTSQLALPVTNPKLIGHESLLFTEEELLDMFAQPGFDVNSFLATHRPAAPAEMTGAIPGDTFGYSLAKWGSGIYNYQYVPTPVLSILNTDNGVTVKAGIQKIADVKASVMVADFQERLALLDNLRSKAEYPEISDSESAMCALSRILKHKNKYFKTGDIPAFVIVTDENESNPSGDRCVDKYNTLVGNEDLIRGFCEERQTTINGTYITITPAYCSVNYKGAYAVSYDYKVPGTKVDYFVSQTVTPRTKISYYKATGYTAPKTLIKYQELTSQSYKRTQVEYYLRECDMRDGVVIESTCRNVKQPAQMVSGDRTSQCIEAAVELNSQALHGSAYASNEQPACVLGAPRALTGNETCDLTDTNCISNITNKEVTVFGIYSDSQESCNSKASSYTKALVNESYQPICEVAASLVATTGVCPESYPNCEQSLEYLSGAQAAIVDGDFTTSNTACQDRAKTLTAAYVNASYPAVCERFSNKITPCDQAGSAACPRTKDIEGSVTTTCESFANAKRSQMPGIILNNTDYPISCTPIQLDRNRKSDVLFTSAILSEGLLATGADCSTPVRSAFLSANSTLPGDGICKISSLVNKVYNENVSSNICEQVLSTFQTARAGTFIDPTVQFNPQKENNNVYKADHKEEFTCNTACAETAFCKPVTGKTVNTSTTVEAYLKSVYNDTFVCSTGTMVKTKVNGSDFSDRLLTEAPNLCQSASSVRRYLVQQGDVYRSIGPTTEFISGTTIVAGAKQPAVGLAQYINDQSAEIFGPGVAIMATFVRQPADGTGVGGSIGVDYEVLADLMGGEKHSVMLTDYSPALKDLGYIIKSKLERSYVVPGLVLPQKIHNVWIRRYQSDAPELLDPALWVQSGTTLALDQSVNLDLGEFIQVEFY